MALTKKEKLQTRLDNCIRGIDQLHIKCLNKAVSLDISYEFQCELCDYVYEGKIGRVNAKGCPNKRNHIQKTKRQKKRETPRQSRKQNREENRKQKELARKQKELEQKHEPEPGQILKQQGLERRQKHMQKHMQTYMHGVREKTKYDRSQKQQSAERSKVIDTELLDLPSFSELSLIDTKPDDDTCGQSDIMYMDELEDRNITCISIDLSRSWWCCDICEYTWKEQFESLIVKLDTAVSLCAQCAKQQIHDNEMRHAELARYRSDLKENNIECVDRPLSIDDTHQWKCLHCNDIWENNFNNILYPYDGCVNCKGDTQGPG